MPTSMHALLPPLRPGSPSSPELEDRRAMFAPTQIDPRLGISSETAVIGNVPCRILNADRSVTILYLHGGGYRMGSPEAYSAYAATVASGARATIVIPKYRLAPENPFPAGLHDAVTVYQRLAATTSRPIVLAGDSAGAGLAAAVAAVVGMSDARAPAGLMLLSPWLDLQCLSPFYESSSDVLFSRATAESAREDYLQGAAHDEPLASPLLADHSAFPPTLVQVGANEALVGDALALADSLAKNNISCTVEVLAGQGHTWPLIHPASDAAQASIASCIRFVAAWSVAR